MADRNVNIHFRTKGADKAEKQFKQLGTTLQSTISAYGSAAIAAYALVRGLKTVTDAFIRQEQAENKLNAILKATKGAAGLTFNELNKMAKGLASVTTNSDEAILEAQALMLTFTKIGKEVFPTALEAAMDMSAVFGQDLQQSMIQLGTALNDPITGIGRLRRIGISFTEDQKKTIKSLAEENDILGAQQVILRELADEFGGYARAKTKTFGGEIDQLKNELVDLQEQWGEVVAKTAKYTKAISFLSSILKAVAEDYKNLNPQVFAMNLLLAESAPLWDVVVNAHGKSSKTLTEQEVKVNKAREAYAKWMGGYRDFVKVYKEKQEKDRLEIEYMQLLLKESIGVVEFITVLGDEYERLNPKMESFNSNINDATKGFRKMKESTKEWTEGIVTTWSQIQPMAEQTIQTFDYVFTETLIREQSFADSMVAGFKSMLERMVAEFAARSAVFGILSALSSPLGFGVDTFSNFVLKPMGIIGVSPTASERGGSSSSVNINMPNVTMINSRSISQINQALTRHKRLH